MTPEPAHQAISWLRLERYRLGESSPRERTEIEAHLDGCAVCRQCWDEIKANQAEARLGILPARAAKTSWWQRLRANWTYRGLGLVATAAVLALVLFRLPRPAPHRVGSVKGSDKSWVILRERDGAVEEDAESFQKGDRFKIEVTCAAGQSLWWDVVVLQSDEVSFPLERGSFPCGNREPLPGAFRLDRESPATICLVAGAELPSRAELARMREDEWVGLGASCRQIRRDAR
jgi:hypothetical protein